MKNGSTSGRIVPADSVQAETALDMEFGPDGKLYLPTAQGVDRYDAETGVPLGRFVSNGLGGLEGARDLSFGPDGLLYVHSPGASRVVRYSAATAALYDVFIGPDQYQNGLRDISVVVPEPSSVWLLAPALLGMRRKRRDSWSGRYRGEPSAARHHMRGVSRARTRFAADAPQSLRGFAVRGAANCETAERL